MKHIELINRKSGWQGHDPMREKAEKLMKGDLRLQSDGYSPQSASRPENTRHRPFKEGGHMPGEKHGHRIPTELYIPRETKIRKQKEAHINDYYAEGGAHHQHLFLGGLKKKLSEGWQKVKPHLKEKAKDLAGRAVQEGVKHLPGAVSKATEYAGRKSQEIATKHLGEERGKKVGDAVRSGAENLGKTAMKKLAPNTGYAQGGLGRGASTMTQGRGKQHAAKVQHNMNYGIGGTLMSAGKRLFQAAKPGLKKMGTKLAHRAVSKGAEYAGEKVGKFAGKHLGAEAGRKAQEKITSHGARLGHSGVEKLSKAVGHKRGGRHFAFGGLQSQIQNFKNKDPQAFENFEKRNRVPDGIGGLGRIMYEGKHPPAWGGRNSPAWDRHKGGWEGYRQDKLAGRNPELKPDPFGRGMNQQQPNLGDWRRLGPTVSPHSIQRTRDLGRPMQGNVSQGDTPLSQGMRVGIAPMKRARGGNSYHAGADTGGQPSMNSPNRTRKVQHQEAANAKGSIRRARGGGHAKLMGGGDPSQTSNTISHGISSGRAMASGPERHPGFGQHAGRMPQFGGALGKMWKSGMRTPKNLEVK